MNFSTNWKCFKHNKLPPQNLEQINTKKYRYYRTTEGENFPSVTSVISLNEHENLKRWKEAVGIEQQEKEKKLAVNRGTKLHEMCELYLENTLKENVDKFSQYDIMGFKRIQHLVNNIQEVNIIEGKIYSKKLRCSGTVDFFGIIDNCPTTLDFKTSKHKKSEDDIENYFIQTTIYSQMIHELYNILPKRIMLIIDNEFDSPSFFVKDISETKYYYDKFINLRKQFFKLNGF